MEQIITNNTVEKLEVTFDGERFGLVHTTKGAHPDAFTKQTIILNPTEAEQVATALENLAKKATLK